MKTLMKEKKEAEDRSNLIIDENAMLQDHLEKTA